MTTFNSHSVFQNYITAKNHKQIWLQICENQIEVYSDSDGK